MFSITNKFCKILENAQHKGKLLGQDFKIQVILLVNINILSNNNILKVMAIIKTNINNTKNHNISNKNLNELTFWSKIGTPSYILNFLI